MMYESELFCQPAALLALPSNGVTWLNPRMRAHQILQLRFPVLRYSISPLFSISTPRPKTLSRQKNRNPLTCSYRASESDSSREGDVVFLSLLLLMEYIEHCSLQQCLPSRFTRNIVKVSARTRGIHEKQGKNSSVACRGITAGELSGHEFNIDAKRNNSKWYTECKLWIKTLLT
jgi:hypothetical protein